MFRWLALRHNVRRLEGTLAPALACTLGTLVCLLLLAVLTRLSQSKPSIPLGCTLGDMSCYNLVAENVQVRSPPIANGSLPSGTCEIWSSITESTTFIVCTR